MRAAVLGSPVAHSLSPALHRAAYTALGLTGWTYDAIECDEAALPAVMAGCGPDWAGLSLTMPLKRAVLPLLDRAEPLVREVGAANTVVFTDGLRQGHNTDVPGMAAAWAEAGLTRVPGASASPDGGALVLGGGATACSALAALRRMGVNTATVAVRDSARAGALLAAADRLGVTVTLTGLDAAARSAPHLLVSTLPAGAADWLAPHVARRDLRARWVFDVVYNPWPTALATAAQAAGATVVGGFDLLLHQAAAQVTLMTGKPAPLAAMRAAGPAAPGARDWRRVEYPR